MDRKRDGAGAECPRNANPQCGLLADGRASAFDCQFTYLIWGTVEIFHGFGVSDLITGLTIVGVGTSLPALASSIIAARKEEHDIALGNFLGSNCSIHWPWWESPVSAAAPKCPETGGLKCTKLQVAWLLPEPVLGCSGNRFASATRLATARRERG